MGKKPSARQASPMGGITWRVADSWSLRSFLDLDVTEAAPDHSTLSRTRRRYRCRDPVDTEPYEAISTSRASAFASRICRGVRQCARRMCGLATTAAMHWARLVATLRRLRLYRNSIPRGASAIELVAIE